MPYDFFLALTPILLIALTLVFLYFISESKYIWAAIPLVSIISFLVWINNGSSKYVSSEFIPIIKVEGIKMYIHNSKVTQVDQKVDINEFKVQVDKYEDAKSYGILYRGSYVYTIVPKENAETLETK